MGQFLDYLSSVFGGQSGAVGGGKVESKGGNPIGSSSSFSQLFSSINKNESDAPPKDPKRFAQNMSQSNRRTIHIYQAIGLIAFLAQLSLVTVPKIQSFESFDLLQPDGWQLVTLSLVPLVVYVASIKGMNEINKPLVEGTKLTSKNAGLDLNNNEFIQSLKIMILLVALCQISSIFSDQFLWSVVMIVPIWCYQLTNKVAQSEYERHAPSPKKQTWVKLGGLSRSSPTKGSPSKGEMGQPPAGDNNYNNTNNQDGGNQVRATPRTRTRKAVKNIITGVSDKYHAFEQNVAHQFSQKLFTPVSPKLRMIES